MTEAPQTAIIRRMPETLRWGACFALALCFHAVGVAALLAHWSENSDLVANAPVITIDLAPLAVAPDTNPNELPPGPQQAQAEPEPEPDPVKPVERSLRKISRAIKFLRDENVPLSVGVFLRDMGFDVVHAKEDEMLGASDDHIMELARREERTANRLI